MWFISSLTSRVDVEPMVSAFIALAAHRPVEAIRGRDDKVFQHIWQCETGDWRPSEGSRSIAVWRVNNCSGLLKRPPSHHGMRARVSLR